MAVRQIVYVSTAMPKLSQAQLRSLLNRARRNNEINDVTGLLVYADGTILQLIEGEPLQIERLYGKISSDPRHKNVTTIIDVETDQRAYPNWRMAYAREDNSRKVEALIDVLDGKEDLEKELCQKGLVGLVIGGFVGRVRHF